MRKKFTMLFTALLCCVGVVKAEVTDLPEVSTEGNIKWYTIKNVRSDKYANYEGANVQFTQITAPALGSYWYLMEVADAQNVPEGYKAYRLYNAANALAVENPGNGNMSENEGVQWPAKVYCIGAHTNDGHTGVVLRPLNGDDSSWNDAGGKGEKIGTYSYDDPGSIWAFEKVNVTEAQLIQNAVAAKTNALSTLATEAVNTQRYYYGYELSAIEAKKAEIEAISVSQTSLVDALTSAITISKMTPFAGLERIAPKAGDKFTMVNKGRNSGKDGLVAFAAGTDVKCLQSPFPYFDAVWTLVATGTEGQFKLYNEKMNVYVGVLADADNTKFQYVSEAENAGVYELANVEGYATFKRVDGGNTDYLHQSNWGGKEIVRWDNGDCSQWQLAKAFGPELTTDANNPICYALKSGRNGDYYFTLDANKVKLYNDKKIATEGTTHWYFMLDESGNLKMYSISDNKAMGYLKGTDGIEKLTNDVNAADYDNNTYTLYFAPYNQTDYNGAWFALKPSRGDTYVSNHSNTPYYMGFYNNFNDAGTRMTFEYVDRLEAKVTVKEGETKYYNTLQEAINAEGAQQVTLLTDVNASEIITINKAITLDGNGKTLTSTAGRAINIETEGTVTISNLNIAAKERAINIINEAATVSLTNVTATASNNAVMIATSAGAVTLNVASCDFTGLAVVNVAGAGSQVEIKATTLKNVDANANENYGAITVSATAQGANVTVDNDCVITVKDDSKKAYVFPGDATVEGVDQVGYVKATIGDAGFETLEGAIEYAKAGQTITLARDIEASEIITINKAITLDGNGKTLTSTAGRAINIETEGTVTISNLNIAAKERAINIINEAATVSLTNVTATASNNAVMIATSAGAVTLNVASCDFTGLAVVNVAGAGSQVKIKATTLKNVDANANENYGAITVSATAQGANVTVTGGEIIVADDSKKAYVFPSDAEVTGVDQVGYVVATIGDAGFETLGDAIEYAKAGSTITLIRDVEASAIITINKAITLDGNGKTLTSTATGTDSNARAINVSGEAANGVTIKNLTIDAKGERAINIIQNATNVTIDNVTATSANYTVNVAGSAPNAVVAIKNSTLNGLCTVNVAAAGANVTVANSTVNCNDNNTTAGESYAALCLNKAAVGASIVATDSEINVAAGSDSEKGRNGAENGNVTINGSTEGVTVTVAVITYPGSDYYHGFTSLADAIKFAKDGDVITLIRDITVSEIINIDKAITLDVNGKKLNSTATGCEFPIAVSQSAEVNVVNCNLTYTREFAEVNTWYALYVPFAVELTDDFLTKYEVAEFSDMTTKSMTITMVEEDKLDANTPYFIRVKDEEAKTLEITVDGAKFNNASPTNLGDVATLNGVYTETEAKNIPGAYAMSSGAFKQAEEEDQVLKPFRFYLMFNEPSQAAALRTISINVDGEEGTTAIDNSIFNNGETVVYDLQGRRVENPTKGIYIVNGKKQIFK